jgi:hypothetical protein
VPSPPPSPLPASQCGRRGKQPGTTCRQQTSVFRHNHLQLRSTRSATRKDRHRPVELSSDHSRPGNLRLFRVGLTCFCFPTNQKTTGASGVKRQLFQNHDVLHFAYFSCKSWRKRRADERTRTADLPSLRVIIHVLQGFAHPCKFRISKPVSFLWLAVHCTVLRSRWCQSGVNIALLSA